MYNWGRQEGSGTSEEEFNSVFGFQLKIKKKKKKELKSQPLVGLFEIQSDSWEVVRDALSDELSSTGAAAPSKTQTLFQLISGGYSSHGSDSKQTVAFVCFASSFFSHSPHRLVSSHGQQIELSVSPAPRDSTSASLRPRLVFI